MSKFSGNLGSGLSAITCAAAVAVSALATAPAAAFQFGNETFSGSWDNTLSYGISSRVQGRDKDLLGLASTTLPNGSAPPGSLGGRAFSVNGDDGNLNYDKGVVSNILRLTTELELEHAAGFGAFVRGLAFYDFENEDGTREKIDLTDPALDLIGSDARLLDAYLFGSFNIGRAPAQLRLGRQVVSWGESTFIQNGINIINPIDVTQIRVPGAELRNALQPVGMLWGSVGVGANGSLEGFYQYEWDQTDPEPSGSYFSSNDFATDGGSKLMLGFGSVPDTVPFGAAAAASIGASPVGVAVPRGDNVDPQDGGQYGLSYHTFVPNLGDTDLGFYFVNYHSRLPIISARSGTPTGLASGDYAGSAQYFIEYPEDIKMLGFSFNTQVATTGWALQGEISTKFDAPLQVDDVELLFAALSPLAIPEAGAGMPGLGTLLANTNQVAPGGVGFGTVIPGFIERDVTQIQLTASNLFPQVLRANEFALIGEIGLTHVNNMPSKSTLRLEAPGTYTSANPALTAAGAQPATEDESAFPDATSWGYRIRGRFTYNNAVGPWALIPSFAWRHDVSGITPGPGGNFLQGRKAISLGLGANLRNQWSAELRYTNFFGAGRHNLINDRDFVSFTIKYSI